MNQKVRLHQMLEWLTFMPPLDKIARALVLDYFISDAAVEASIWHLNDQDALTCLAVYGSTDVNVGAAIPGSTWRESSDFKMLISQSRSSRSAVWSDSNTRVVVNLYAQGMLIGYITLRFAKEIIEIETRSNNIEEFAALISLYLAWRLAAFNHQNGASTRTKSNASRNGKPHLTERQQMVLAGIVKRKTNNAIASDLGYSVSTIRHETMRIFESLGVANRVEAASFAVTLGII